MDDNLNILSEINSLLTEIDKRIDQDPCFKNNIVFSFHSTKYLVEFYTAASGDEVGKWYRDLILNKKNNPDKDRICISDRKATTKLESFLMSLEDIDNFVKNIK